MDKLLMSYRVNDLKEAFEIYVLKCEADFKLDDEIDVHGEIHSSQWLFDQLKTCAHFMPTSLCEYLEVKHDTTYAEAVINILHKLK
jgi:hypothetical protein